MSGMPETLCKGGNAFKAKGHHAQKIQYLATSSPMGGERERKRKRERERLYVSLRWQKCPQDRRNLRAVRMANSCRIICKTNT